MDHYEEVGALITILSDTSLRSYGNALQRAMDEGATGTEIFMALRWNLEQLLNEKHCSGLVKAKATRLWEEVNKVLQ